MCKLLIEFGEHFIFPFICTWKILNISVSILLIMKFNMCFRFSGKSISHQWLQRCLSKSPHFSYMIFFRIFKIQSSSEESDLFLLVSALMFGKEVLSQKFRRFFWGNFVANTFAIILLPSNFYYLTSTETLGAESL